MYQLAETPDSRIAQYSFGKSISQFGMTVFSCSSARQGKKIFGNDPDPTTEIILDSTADIVSAHIAANPNGKVAAYEDIIRECGHTYQVHYRTVAFGSTWKSCSLKPARYSIIYHDGAHTNFRFTGINRLTSMDDSGVVACCGFEDKTATNRLIHYITESSAFTPHEIGSILIPMHDLYYHKTKLFQHLPFVVSEPDEVQLNIDKPTVIVEFISGDPDVSAFTTSWLNQIEEGFIEIVNR